MLKNLLVIGGGESGVGAAVLASVKGWNVFVTDKGIIKDKYKRVLNEYSIDWEEGKHTIDRFNNIDLVIKSPGVPFSIPMIQDFVEKGIEVIDEIEFASFYTNSKMICITGSNGKTTTTLLTYYLLKKAGLKVGLAGNIGKSLAYQVATENFDVYVVELSSFQLDGMNKFKADFAVIMNITPDHLDRYDYSIENYAKSKFRVTQNMKKDDVFLYCKDDELTNKYISDINIKAKRYPFSIEGVSEFYVNYNNKEIQLSSSELSLKGKHNKYNCMVAATAALYMNVSEDIITEGLSDFSPVEHRLEPVSTVGGVRFINDSKATNVDSCWYALDSMPTNVIWIAGGKDKGNDYSVLFDLVKTKVKALICLGVDNEKLLEVFTPIINTIEEAKSADEAVSIAKKISEKGDVVLLSPCCASFDLFNSYEDRGRQFKEAVQKLNENE